MTNAPATHSRKVLVVDDSRTVRAHLAHVLEELGVTVIFAADGLQGIEQFRANPDLSLAFVDVSMPNLDGISMIEQLSSEWGSQGKALPPIIMVTTENSKEMVNRARGAGIKGWIVKPFRPDALKILAEKFAK